MTEQSSPRDADGTFPWRRWLGRHGRSRADVVNALVGPPGARRSVLARCQRATEADLSARSCEALAPGILPVVRGEGERRTR